MSRHIAVVNTEEDVQKAVKKLSSPYLILVKDIEKVIYRRPASDAIILVDDWNNFRDKLPVIQRDISWIEGRRCLVKKTEQGVAICYLDPNNSELFHDGVTEAKLDGSMGQWMVDLPEFYIECYEGDSDWVKLYIDRNPGYGKKSRRTLLGVTKGILRNNQLWSCKYNQNGSQERASSFELDEIMQYINNLGKGFQLFDYETYCKVAYMFMAKYKSRNPILMDKFGANMENWFGINNLTGETAFMGNNDGIIEDLQNTHWSILGIEDYAGQLSELLGGVHGYRDEDSDDEMKIYIYDGFQPRQEPSVQYRTIDIQNYLGMSGYGGYVNRLEWGEYSDLFPLQFNGSYGLFYGGYIYIGKKGWSVFKTGNEWAPSLFSLYDCDDNQYFARIQYRDQIEVIDDPQEFIQIPVGF